MSLRRHLVVNSPKKPPANHQARLAAEFDKWIGVFTCRTDLYTQDMKNKFVGLVKAAKDLACGKNAANNQIGLAYKDKAWKFLNDAAACLGKPVKELPTTLKAFEEAFQPKAAEIAKYREENAYYRGKLFKKIGMPLKPVQKAASATIVKGPSLSNTSES